MDIFKLISNIFETILIFLKRDSSDEFKKREEKQQNVNLQDRVELLVKQVRESKNEKERLKLLEELRKITAY